MLQTQLDDDNKQVVGNIMGNPSISHSVLLQQPVVTNQFVETDQSDVVLPDDNDSMDVEETPNDVSLYFILPCINVFPIKNNNL